MLSLRLYYIVIVCFHQNNIVNSLAGRGLAIPIRQHRNLLAAYEITQGEVSFQAAHDENSWPLFDLPPKLPRVTPLFSKRFCSAEHWHQTLSCKWGTSKRECHFLSSSNVEKEWGDVQAACRNRPSLGKAGDGSRKLSSKRKTRHDFGCSSQYDLDLSEPNCVQACSCYKDYSSLHREILSLWWLY